jgi:hypothetical protein
MDLKHIPVSAIKPCQHEHFITNLEVAQAVLECRLENKPSCGCALGALFWCC